MHTPSLGGKRGAAGNPARQTALGKTRQVCSQAVDKARILVRGQPLAVADHLAASASTAWPAGLVQTNASTSFFFNSLRNAWPLPGFRTDRPAGGWSGPTAVVQAFFALNRSAEARVMLAPVEAERRLVAPGGELDPDPAGMAGGRGLGLVAAGRLAPPWRSPGSRTVALRRVPLGAPGIGPRSSTGFASARLGAGAARLGRDQLADVDRRDRAAAFVLGRTEVAERIGQADPGRGRRRRWRRR